MVKFKFRSWDDEARKIKYGKLKSIRREIDRLNPVFQELEDINGRRAAYEVDPEDPFAMRTFMIEINDKDGFGIAHGVISKVSYLDGDVIIDWVDFTEHKNLNKPKTLKKHERS